MGLTPDHLQQALIYLSSWQSLRQAMTISDHEIVATRECMGCYLLNEVRELNAELEAEPNSADRSALNTEMIDILIFLMITFRVTGFRPDFSLSAQTPANYKEVSLKIEMLLAECNQMIERLDFAQLERMFLIWRELAEYFSIDFNISMLMMHKLTENGWNRPAEYYQVYDQDFRAMSDEEIFAKFEHTEKCLRIIRDHFSLLLGRKTPLYKWMHQPFTHVILDFQNSTAAIAQLQYELNQSQPIYLEMLKKTVNGSGYQTLSAQELSDLAVIAGGVVLPDPARKQPEK